MSFDILVIRAGDGGGERGINTARDIVIMYINSIRSLSLCAGFVCDLCVCVRVCLFVFTCVLFEFCLFVF